MPDTAKLRDRKPDLGVVGARLADLSAWPWALAAAATATTLPPFLSPDPVPAPTW